MVGEHGFLKDKITSLRFNNEGNKLASTSTDISYGVIDLTSGNSSSKKNPHGVKSVSRAAFGPTGDLYTVGDDCVIRTWKC